MTITLKGIIDTDTINYKKMSMILEFPKCDFKCDRECGQQVCQNSTLATAPNIRKDVWSIIDKYLYNPITQAICIQGLEPFDSYGDLLLFIKAFRSKSDDDIVIYTGYNKDEIATTFNILKNFPNIIIKFGRYIPNQQPHYDEVLGINLASDNQYAEKIS